MIFPPTEKSAAFMIVLINIERRLLYDMTKVHTNFSGPSFSFDHNQTI